MAEIPGVAAFMPVLNEGGRIGRAIRSLQEQTHQISKLYVIDGGSTDATHDEVREMDARTDFDIELHVLEGAGVRYSSQFGAEQAASHLIDETEHEDGIILRLEGDSALQETFVEESISYLADSTYSVFGAPVRPHNPDTRPVTKRVFTFVQNGEKLPKGRAMAFRACDFRDVNGYRMDADEDIASSYIDCLEDGILVTKLQEEGKIAFSMDTCVYSTVPSTTATSVDRWKKALVIERKIGPTGYFTRIANPLNRLVYAGSMITMNTLDKTRRFRQIPSPFKLKT